MSAEKSSNTRCWILASAGLLMLSVLGGCVDYLEHRDTITLRAGDAQAWNKTIHTADPWPPYVMNNHIPGDGQRTAAVIQRYSTGNSVDGAPAGAAAGAVPPAQ